MSQILGIFDGGTGIIKHKGQSIQVGVVRFRVQQNDSAPFEIKGYYNKMFRKQVINGLRYLRFLREKEESIKIPEDDMLSMRDDQGEGTGCGRPESGITITGG